LEPGNIVVTTTFPPQIPGIGIDKIQTTPLLCSSMPYMVPFF